MTTRRFGDARRLRVAVVGAGLSGPLLAVLLARRGHEVTLYERRVDPLSTAQPPRSINLTICERGLSVLREVGLERPVLDEHSTVLRSRAVHRADGGVTHLPYGAEDGQTLHAVPRADLSRFLLDRAVCESRVHLVTGHRLVALDRDQPEMVLENVRTGSRQRRTADLVVGADGTHSAVRRHMHGHDFVDVNVHYVPWRYKEFTIEGGLAADSLHAWPRGDCLMFAQPNRRGGFNGVIVLPATGPNSFEAVTTAGRAEELVRSRFGDVAPWMPHLATEFHGNPIGAFPSLVTSRWHHRGQVVLVGDAAHSVLPFYGQGMNAAFEDCLALDRSLAELPDDREAALTRYQAQRKPHTDVLTELSMVNFAEMRQSHGQYRIAARRRLVQRLHRHLGDRMVPLYSMVAHTNLPYAECVARAGRQDRLLRRCGADLVVGATGGLAWINDQLRRTASQAAPAPDRPAAVIAPVVESRSA